MPWLKSANRWQVLAAEVLLERASDIAREAIWPLLSKYASPSTFASRAAEVLEIASWIDAIDPATKMLEIAHSLVEQGIDALTDDVLDELVENNQIRQGVADLAMLVSTEAEEPVVVSTGAIRVANRVDAGGWVEKQNRHTQGRIAIARLVGYGDRSREAHLGLVELAATICHPKSPTCGECPLNTVCEDAFQV